MSASVHGCWLAISAALLAAGLAAPKPDAADVWAVRGATYRIALHAEAAPDLPEAGWEIRLPDFGAGRPDMGDVVLMDEKNKEIALDPVWRGAERTLLLLAETMPEKNGRAMLYFGGTSSRRAKSWQAGRSLLLETRRLPAAVKLTTAAGWQAAWNKAKITDGVAFVPNIFQGGNPFGQDDHYLSRFTGLLKTGEGGERKFYTLSDDVSFVTIAGRAALKWSQSQPPPLAPHKVPLAAVKLPKGQVAVEYTHATVDPPGAMVLGWEQDGVLGTIPATAWAHPGRVKTGTFETADGSPAPVPEFEAEHYFGFAGEWYVVLKAKVAGLSEGWRAEWLWPDGRSDQGPEVRRLWFGQQAARVVLRVKDGKRTNEGRRTLVIPREMPAASVNNAQQLEDLLGLLAKENPAALPEPARRAGFLLAESFLQSTAAAKWAEAWLAVATPGGDPWSAAMSLAIRETARTDPKAALERLNALPQPARAALGVTADLLELELRVFALKDPLVVGLAAKLAKHPDQAVARMAKIRLGDYHLLGGRIVEALRCFAEATPNEVEAAGKAPVIDRAHSLALEDLINGKQLDLARAKLESWELQRPAARVEGDHLLWRARVAFLAGEWQRALQDLETSLSIRPGAPEEIETRFWLGRTLHELGRNDEARKIWQQLIDDYPKHERSESAKQWLAKP